MIFRLLHKNLILLNSTTVVCYICVFEFGFREFANKMALHRWFIWINKLTRML
jgi:hypothetical protein